MEHRLSKTRLYSIYSGMKQRCYNPNNQHYQWYGAKGITICDEWMGENGLQNFIEWSLNHGYEEHLTIGRKENDKAYSPDNCQWVTASLNSSRANIAPLDESHTMGNSQKIRMALAYKGMSESELAKALGKTPQAFNQRMKTDKFSTEDLSKIAEVMGASYISQFSFPDGTKI